MMAKPAATKIRLGSKNHGRPPRPDPPLLRHLPPPPPPETRRRRSLRPRRRRQRQISGDVGFELEHEEEEEEERGLKKIRLVVKLPRSPAGRPNRAAAVPTISSSSSSPSPSPVSSSSSSYVEEDELEENGDDDVETVKPLKKRRIERCSEFSAVVGCRSGYREEMKKNALRRSSGVGSGNLPSPWRGTLMPEKMELELILQKLQKKDTYNAFAEPVDPEELPDYHDVIEHPMDFGTVRKKLERGAYRSFEQFEDDVLLICSNAMQYNAPDTVYFRQACAIQELARKKFQIVRENLKHAETEKSHQRSKGKANNLTPMVKKIPRTLCTPKIQCKAVVEPIMSDLSSGATLASAGDTSTGLSTVNGIEKSVAVNEPLDASSSLEGGKQDKSSAVNGFLDASSSLEESKQEKSVAVNGHLDASSSLGVSKQEKPVCINGVLDASSSLRESKQEKSVAVNELLDGASSPGESKQDKGDDFLAKCSPSKLGRKATLVDENRRATYNTTPQQKPMVESNFVLNLFEDEEKQLIPVGLDFEHSYARSLARFTALLGPVAWEIASKKIENALPPGIKFGPGWVGEYEPLPTPFLSVENSTSFSKTARNDKFAEMKSKDEHNPISSNKELLVKKQLASKTPRKASNSVNSTSCANLVEQKPRFIGVDSPAKSKINGTVGQKQCTDSRRIKVGVNNQINNRTSSVTPVRIKEETPCDEIEERRQEAINANDLAQKQATTQRNSHQQQNQATVEFPKPLSNALPQAHQGEPLNKTGLTSFPVIFSRESSHMQTETQKVFQAVSSQNLNTAPEISTRGSNTGARLNNSLAFISANQTGVNYSLGRGNNNNNNNNHDHASNYPFKLESFPGKVGNQQNFSNSSTTHVDQSMPIVSPRSKENFSPATSAAAKAWMSVRTSGQWKSVDSKNSSEKPSMISSPFYSPPTWKPPTSAPQFNGYSMVRPANIPSQVEASQVKNRGLVIFPQLIPTDLSKYQHHPSWQVSSPQPQSKQRDNLPPDLNIGYQAPGSPIQPSSSLAMDSQQPDLALQL